jgi:hypothetical protein
MTPGVSRQLDNYVLFNEDCLCTSRAARGLAMRLEFVQERRVKLYRSIGRVQVSQVDPPKFYAKWTTLSNKNATSYDDRSSSACLSGKSSQNASSFPLFGGKGRQFNVNFYLVCE